MGQFERVFDCFVQIAKLLNDSHRGNYVMKLFAAGLTALLLVAAAGAAEAQAFRPLPSTVTPLTLGDDNDVPVTLPFAINLGADPAITAVYLSQNVYIFTSSGAHNTPYFDDLEARGDTGQANYGSATVDGRPAFIATYRDVGYCCGVAPERANVQLVLKDRSDIAPGDFDVEVNTEGLFRASSPNGFQINHTSVGRAGVGVFPAGPGAYRATWTIRGGVLTSGTGPVLMSAAAVPTMSEWSMIILGLIMAGGTAVYLQRRRSLSTAA